jgi:hypothetical protein
MADRSSMVPFFRSWGFPSKTYTGRMPASRRFRFR